MTVTASRKTLAQRVMRAGIAVGIAHLLFKLAGLVQAWAMARYLPAAIYDASYVVAFEGVIFSLFLVGEESLAPACLPTFMRELDTVGERAAWRFANTLLALQGIALIVVVGVLMAFPEWITRLWTQWSEASHPEAFAMAAAVFTGWRPRCSGSRWAPPPTCCSTPISASSWPPSATPSGNSPWPPGWSWAWA